MRCEIRNNQNEVVLRNPTFADVVAVIHIWLHKNKEIAFSRPDDESLEGENGNKLESALPF